MKTTPLILGATAFATCLGVALGATVPTDPLTNGADPLADVPRHQPTPVDFASVKRNLPNHYPLETPQGTIEVAQLSDYGLYRNKHYTVADFVYRPDPQPELAVAEQEQAATYMAARYEEPPQQQAQPAARYVEPVEVATDPLARKPVKLDAGLVEVDTTPPA